MEKILNKILRYPAKDLHTTLDIDLPSLLQDYPFNTYIELFFSGQDAGNDDASTNLESSPSFPMQSGKSYRIKVKKYMTQVSSDEFDFMKKFNDDIPMPCVIMSGKIIKETRGMFYMELEASPIESDICIRCGRTLTYPISRLYGVGPECGQHFYISPLDSLEQYEEFKSNIVETLKGIKWKGWVIKSAIVDFKEVQ